LPLNKKSTHKRWPTWLCHFFKHCLSLQAEMNKKRDAELTKLRKLLEDVHLESEENAHHLRQKHQAAVAEMQDQIDQLQKAKNK
jgi:paramyosin